jgi:hypothetical protein
MIFFKKAWPFLKIQFFYLFSKFTRLTVVARNLWGLKVHQLQRCSNFFVYFVQKQSFLFTLHNTIRLLGVWFLWMPCVASAACPLSLVSFRFVETLAVGPPRLLIKKFLEGSSETQPFNTEPGKESVCFIFQRRKLLLSIRMLLAWSRKDRLQCKRHSSIFFLIRLQITHI